MDWYTWLSKTNLEQTLIYEYGLAFVRNELQEEDLAYFNHEFLQSVGISIAKHRLEIIKLARKDMRGSINGLSTRLVHAVNKTRKLFTKSIIGKKLMGSSTLHMSKNNPSLYPVSELSPYRNQWSGALKRLSINNGSSGSEKEKSSSDQKKAVISRSRNVMWSGPLDKRMQEKLMMTHSVSGPLDGKNMMYPRSPNVNGPMKEQKLGFICKSPTIPGPTMDKWAMSPLKVNYYSSEKVVDIDEDGAQSLWSLMFQDMKPT